LAEFNAAIPAHRNPLLVAALRHARQGHPILPLHNPVAGECSCGKRECKRIGKHPRVAHGVKDASTDPTQIKRWWKTWPEANIGIAVGPESGLVVVDVDGSAGIRSLRKLLKSKRLPGTLVALTGRINKRGRRVGAHLYYALPEGAKIRNSNGALGEGIEVKASRQYVIAPPSLHESGARYKWVKENASIWSAPDWLVRRAENVSTQAQDDVGPIPEGRRDDTLFRMGKSRRWSGLSENEVERELINVNRERCEPPLDIDHVQQIAANVFTYSDEESLLMKAWKSVLAATCSTRREKFVALIENLDCVREGREIFLPVKTLAPLLGCKPRDVSSLRNWAERQGIIEKSGDYTPHVMPQKFRVLHKRLNPH
jgi:hypothetical protein